MAVPASPTPASAERPRRPTKSVSTSVITPNESIEIAIGHESRASSSMGLSFQGN